METRLRSLLTQSKPKNKTFRDRHSRAWGLQTSLALSKKVENKLIVANVSGVDWYDRAIAEVFVGERNINHEMVSEGHARAYRR